jgi:hypothetical protein
MSLAQGLVSEKVESLLRQQPAIPAFENREGRGSLSAVVSAESAGQPPFRFFFFAVFSFSNSALNSLCGTLINSRIVRSKFLNSLLIGNS